MTLAVAWRRNIQGVDELLVATDSRLTGSMVWDVGPKVFDLARGDAVVAFAGSTLYAYPLIQQLRASLDAFNQTRNRAQDISSLPNHILNLLDAMVDDSILHDLVRPKPQELDIQILLAGYSWKYSRYRIWRFSYDGRARRFVKIAASTRGSRTILYAGDGESVARFRVNQLLRTRRLTGIDMEPFEVLCDMSLDGRFHTIGGPPQVLKVYRHGNTLPLCVYWPKGEPMKALTFAGRELLAYEQSSYRRIDPDTLMVTDGATYHAR